MMPGVPNFPCYKVHWPELEVAKGMNFPAWPAPPRVITWLAPSHAPGLTLDTPSQRGLLKPPSKAVPGLTQTTHVSAHSVITFAWARI